MERGMLDLTHHGSGVVRCCAASCGWEGVPVFWRGRPLTFCPKCEGFGDEPDLRTKRFGRGRPIRGIVSIRPPRFTRRPGSQPRVSRNQPCPCGSGRKAKKCCYN